MAAPSSRPTTSTSPSVRQPLPITARYACTAIDPRLHHTRRTCLRRHHTAPTSSSPQHPRDPHPCKRPLPQDPTHPYGTCHGTPSPSSGALHGTPHGTTTTRPICPRTGPTSGVPKSPLTDACSEGAPLPPPWEPHRRAPPPMKASFGPSPPLDISTRRNGTSFPRRGRGAQWC